MAGGSGFQRFRQVCIFGAGAIGGALAARLATSPALADLSISVIARGAHLDAIRARGLQLWTANSGAPLVARVRATADAADLGPQDLVISAVKGHQLPAICPDLKRLLKPETRLVIIQNGIPWWYFHGDAKSGYEGRQIEELDPGGALWREIGPERVMGGIAYHGAEMRQPGAIDLTSEGRFILGEPVGGLSGDLDDIAALFEAADWTATRSDRIRDEIWLKLQGNASFNPISALTRADMVAILESPRLLALTIQIMTEVRAVAEALGCRIELSTDERIERTRALGPVKTSILQDVVQGRRLEVVPLTLAISLLAQMTGVATPANDAILALVDQLDRSLAG